jgi:hypothetical protein
VGLSLSARANSPPGSSISPYRNRQKI